MVNSIVDNLDTPTRVIHIPNRCLFPLSTVFRVLIAMLFLCFWLVSCSSDDGNLKPPEGEDLRLVNKDAQLCAEWESMVLVAAGTAHQEWS